MRKSIHKKQVLIALLAALCLSVGAARIGLAQGMQFTNDWWVFGAGGGQQSAGPVTLNATIGQPVAGLSSSGSTGLSAGYWVEIEVPIEIRYGLFFPIVSK